MSVRRASFRHAVLAASVLSAAILFASSPASSSVLALTVQPIGLVAPAAPADAIAPAAAPSAPSSLAGQSVQPDTAVLLWKDNSNNETGFVVEGRSAGDPTFQSLGDPLPANTTTATVVGLSAGVTYEFRIRATNASGDSGATNVVAVTALSSSDCQSSATAMCLHNNEFRVQALFLAGNGQSGQAQTVKLVADSGYLWFFASSNIEAVVKVLDGCASNSHFWVFAGGLTNVRVLLTVTDTVAEISKSYSNPLGAAFQPIQDTSAFATCGN